MKLPEKFENTSMLSDEVELPKEEIILAQQLKENYCDNLGRETNTKKAADIFHKIGLIYRKLSPDKISLIKSTGLLNAAIFRGSSNLSKIKEDLSELCQHVLQSANAKKQDEDLIKKGKEVKRSIVELRKEVRTFLKTEVAKERNPKKKASNLNTEKVFAIEQLNKLIADKYKQIMVDLSQFCEDVMGKPPCKYAIVGMGSLAREEITPYSDFEHIILLPDVKNYKSHLDYYRWFSVIFHVVVLNVQETIIPSLNIRSLNDKNSSLGDWYYDAVTPRGISFDGMMPHACKFPLGQKNVELIKPVSKMLDYLSSEADLKNGYHLADILTKTCFVFGNENIFQLFSDGVKKYRDTKSKTDAIDDIKKQVKEDLDRFSTRFRLTTLKSRNTINIKQLVYRSTTLFISALARKHNISENSCFNIINEMAQNNTITQNTANKLKFAIAIACEMRLRVYITKKSQSDNVINFKENGTKKFLDIVGVANTINYFQIAYCLQCEVAKQLNFTKLHFYSDPHLINITIGLAFGMRVCFSKDLRKAIWNPRAFDFDLCIKQLETEFTPKPLTKKNFGQKLFGKTSWLFKKKSTRSFSSIDLSTDEIESIVKSLMSTEIFDEASEFSKQLLAIYENQSKDIDSDDNLAKVNHQIGYCLNALNREAEALTYLQRTVEIRKNTAFDTRKDRNVAATLHNIGYSHMELHNYDEALTNLKQALEIEQKTTHDANLDRDIAVTYHEMGRCYLHLHDYDKALANLGKALQINENTTSNADKDRDIACVLHTTARCHADLQNYDKALLKSNREFRIKQNTSFDIDRDRTLAITHLLIGRCLTGLQQYEKAWKSLERSLEVFQNTTLHEDDYRFAYVFHRIGECLMGKQQYAEALKHLQRSSEIFQSRTNWEKDRSFAAGLHSTGICMMKLHEYKDALSQFQKALQIYENLPLNDFIANKIQSIRSKADLCLLKLE